MKKALSFVLTFTLIATAISLLTLSASAYVIEATVPDFKITLNGTVVDNSFREYPFLNYKGITYVPMTYYDSRFLGLNARWDDASKTLFVEKSRESCAYRAYKTEKRNVKVHSAYFCDYKVNVNGVEIDNAREEHPLLTYKNVTYFPLTWRFTMEEFGWEYYGFDMENGLVINSDNHHTKTVELPGITGAVAYDGTYYVYNARQGENNYVYAYNDSENYYDKGKIRILHQLPFTNLSRHASFVSGHDGIYAVYTAGTSPIMSSSRCYEVDARQGIFIPKNHDKWFYGNHGMSEYEIRNEIITVNAINPYFDSATEISYTKNGQTVKVPALEGRLRIGFYRNGKVKSADASKLIKIFKDKIYYVAADLNLDDRSSNLYVIDTNKGVSEKLIDGVCGFDVYNGWSNELRADTTMILFDRDGVTMRYSEKDGKIITVDEYPENTKGLILDCAVGGITGYAAYQAIDGSRTVIKRFGAYASGTTSGNGTVFESTTGTSIVLSDGKLIANTLGESPKDDIRLLVVGDGVEYKSCDAAKSVFLRNDVLVYSLYDNSVVKVYLK